MALELKITKQGVSADGTVLTLIDSTGDYSSENPTGYGTPNPSRSSLYLIMNVSNNRSTGDVDCTYVMNPDSYNAVSTWSVNVSWQGWYQARVYGLLAYSTNTSFQINEAAYDVSNQQIVKILTKSGSSAPYTYTTEVINKLDLDDSSVITPYDTVLHTDVITQLCTCVSKQNEKIVKLIKQGKDFESERLKLQEFQSLLDGGKYDFYSNEAYSEAQLTWEALESRCTCFDDLTDGCGCGC